jgi:uncharacterized protein (TIGR03435 family)
MASLLRAGRVLFSGLVLAATAYTQTNPGPIDLRPAFDVASVKANNTGTGVDRIRNNGGILLIENVSLKRLIGIAFDIPEWQSYLFSGPDWLDLKNFDLQARFPPDTTHLKFLQMFQRLLEERFSMVLHREPREFSVLVLVPGKKRKEGVTLRPAAAPPGSSYRFRAVDGHATGSSISMSMLAGRLSRPDFGLDRPVLDYTGLEGIFDLTLDWKPERVQDGSVPGSGSDASIFVAIEEQLGLKLERRKVSLGVLVIDRISKAPSEN